MESYFTNTRKLLGSLATLAVLLLLLFAITSTAIKPQNGSLQVHFLDVGQGDAELIQTQSGQNILIDGGPDDTVLSRLDSRLPVFSRKIDVVVLTHPHADHVSGLVDVLRKYKVETAYFSGVNYTTQEYLDFLNLLKDGKISTKAVKAGDKLDLGDGVVLEFLFPLKDVAGMSAENVNDTSVVTRLTYGRQAALFMGDLEAEQQGKILASGQNVKSTIYKAPHHGSKDSVNSDFLKAVDPKYVVIEVGKNNKFGHPSAKALKDFGGRIVLRTDQEGDISFEIGESATRLIE